MQGFEMTAIVTAFILYFIATVFFISHLVLLKTWLARAGRCAAAAGLIANLAGAIWRTVLASHAPFANMYEFGIVLVAVILCGYLWVDFRYSLPSLGAFILPVAFLFLGVFILFYQEAKPLMPALKSNWLLAHVATAVIAYGALAFSFAAALMCRWRRYLDKGASPALLALLPDPQILEYMMNRAIILAMPFLTLLIITGAVWAEYAWGAYWRWDPKETWSLITWLVYAAYLHGRAVYAWRGQTAINWALSGFLIVIFTFIGVNVLLPGLHSYQ